MDHEWWPSSSLLDDNFEQIGSGVWTKVERPPVPEVGHPQGVLDGMEHLLVIDSMLPGRLEDLHTAIA